MLNRAALRRRRRGLLLAGEGESGATPFLTVNPTDFTTGALVDTNPGVDAVYNTQPADYSQTVVTDVFVPGYTKSVRQNWTALSCALGNQNLGMRFGFTSGFLSNDLPGGTNNVWVEFWERLPVGWDQGAACGFPEEKKFQIFESRSDAGPTGRWELTTGGGGIRTGNPSNGGASALVNLAGNHPDYIPFSATPNDGYVPVDAFYDAEWHRFGLQCQWGGTSVVHRVWAANRANNEMVLIHYETWNATARTTNGYTEWQMWGAPMNQTPQATQERHGLPVLVYTSDPGWPT